MSLTPSLTEVDRIFDHPLEAMLDPELLLNNAEPLVGEGEDWPYGARELHVRLCSFPCARVFGVTCPYSRTISLPIAMTFP